MNTNILKLSLAAGSAALLFGLAGACGDDLVGGDCVTDLDCTDPANPTCQPFTGECGTLGCMADTDCGGATPVCNLADANGVRPFPSVAADVCVCDGSSCTGSVCSNVGGACVLGCSDTSSSTDPRVKLQCPAGVSCDQGTGTCLAACTDVGMLGADPCLATEVCVTDGTCEQPCDSLTDCVATEELCQADATNASFNACVAPGMATEQCANFQMATGVGRDAGGPLITSVTYDRDGTDTAPNCTGAATPRYFNAVISDDGTFDTSLYTMRLLFLQQDGTETFTFSEGPMTSYHPSIMARAGAANVFDLTFSLCLSDAQMMSSLAIYMTNDADEKSNGFCFTGL